MNGSAGQLVFTDPAHAVPLTERGIAVGFGNDTYTLTGKDGTTYVLGGSADSRDFTRSETRTSGGDHDSNLEYHSAYYLTAIISANRQDTVYFSYSAETITQAPRPTETGFLPSSAQGAPPAIDKSFTASTQEIIQHKLQEIRWRNGRLRFGAATLRLDLLGAGQLDYLEICDRNNVAWKRYEFRYGYFYSNPDLANAQPIPGKTYDPSELRLKLLGVAERGGSERVPEYQFHYYEHRGIPPINSAQQDHWGFANRNSANTLLPGTSSLGNGVAGYPQGGDRNPSFHSALAGLLREIVYPTGGATRLVYEPHTALTRYNTTKTTKYALQVSEKAPNGDLIDIAAQEQFTLTSNATVDINYSGVVSYQTPDQGKLTVGVLFNGSPLTSCTTPPNPISPAQCSSNGVLHRNLSPGVYTMYATGYVDAGARAAASVICEVTELVETVTNQPVGGARIKRLVDVANAAAGDSVVTAFSYDVTQNGQAVSSGVLVSEPKYTFPYQIHYAKPTGAFTFEAGVYSYTGFSSSPKAGLGNTQGSHVGYGQVTVATLHGPSPNGRTVYTYTAEKRGGGLHLPPLPDYENGLLLTQTWYRASGDPVKKISNTYRFDTRTDHQLKGMAVYSQRSVAPQLENKFDAYTPGFYYIRDKWVYVQQTTTTLYAPGNVTHQQEQRQVFIYGNPDHGLVTQVRTVEPSGEQRVQYRRYPPDLTSGQADIRSQGLERLRAAHVFTPVIEESEWVKKGTGLDSLLIKSVVHTYRPGRLAGGVEDKLYYLDLDRPATTYAAPAAMPGGWQMDRRYREKESYDVYDARENLQQVTLNGHTSMCYLWGYNAALPVAQVKNTTYAQVLAALGQATLDQLSDPEPGPDAQVRQLLQPLRTQLPRAQVTVYTHRPLVGMTSQTDPSGRTITYEYDALGRLVRTRDEQGRLLTQNAYKYATQP